MRRQVAAAVAFSVAIAVGTSAMPQGVLADEFEMFAPTFYVATPAREYAEGSACADPDFWVDGDWSDGGDLRDGAAPGLAYDSDDDAIQDAVDGATSGSVIYICAGVYVFADQVEIDSGMNITMQGDGIDITIIDGDETTRIFDADGVGENDQGGTLTLVDFSIFDAHTADELDNGGAVIADGLSLVRVQIAGSDGAYNGGALYAEGDVSIEDSAFYNNNSSRDGAALYAWNNDTSTTISSSTFDGNQASGYAGAILVNGNLEIHDSEFVENFGAEYGGAVVNTAGDKEVVISDSTFTNNLTDANGGALVMHNLAALTITESFFTGNLAGSFGGAMNIAAIVSVNIVRSDFVGNEALGGRVDENGNGGAVDACDIGRFSSSSSRYIGNYSTRDGGAIGLFGGGCSSPGSIVLTKNLFRDNSAWGDGGALWLSGVLEKMTGNRFIRNEADELGGAVFGGSWADGELSSQRIERNSFKSNSAGEAGGALWLPGNIESLRRNLFRANRTEGDGGAVAINGLYWIAIRGNLMFRNQADARGGAFYLQCSYLNRSSLQRLAGANRLSGNVARDSRRTSRIYQAGIC
ncbi:MAG: hypothetical protein ACO232_03515 [Candidatus Limnocylindrus sp.]